MKPDNQKAKFTEGDRSSPVAMQRKERVVDFLCRDEKSLTGREKGQSHTQNRKTNSSFSEKSHGKGTPDEVGSAVKRCPKGWRCPDSR